MPRNRNKMPKGEELNKRNEELYSNARRKVQAPKTGSLPWLKESLQNMMRVRKMTIKSNKNNNNNNNKINRAIKSSKNLNRIQEESKNITNKHKRSSSALARPINGRINTEADRVKQMALQFVVLNNNKNRREKMRNEIKKIKQQYPIRQRGKPATAASSGQAAKALGLKVKKRKPSKKIKPSKKSKKSK